MGGAPAGGRGRDLGRQQRRPGLPARARRLLPGRPPRRSARAGSSTRTSGPSPRSSSTPAATNDPQLHIHNAVFCRVLGRGRAVAHAGLARACTLHRPAAGAVADRTTVEHAGRVAARAGRDAPGRQGPRAPRHRRSRSTTCSPAGRARSAPKAAELVAAFEAALRPRTERAGTATGCSGRPRCSPGPGSPTTARPSNSASTGGSGSCRPRSSVGLDQVAADVLALAEQEAPRAQRFDPDAVIETAIADVQASKAAWTKPT